MRAKPPIGVIVDVDNTLVDVSSIKHLQDAALNPDGTYSMEGLDVFHEAALECPAIWPMVDRVMSFWTLERYDIIIVTARGERYRSKTQAWLKKYAVPHNALYMRPEDDQRSDVEVKNDIYSQIENKWRILYAMEDREDVAELWRSKSLTVIVPGTKTG